MVNILRSPACRQQSAFGIDCGEAAQPDALAMNEGFDNRFGGYELPTDPSTCVFWCAVALGSLVKGSPIESVSGLRRANTGWEHWRTIDPDEFSRTRITWPDTAVG